MRPVQADHTQKKRKRNEDEARELTVGQAQQAIFRNQSLQVRPNELRTDAQKHAIAMSRHRDDVVASIAELERTQDELLDRLGAEVR